MPECHKSSSSPPLWPSIMRPRWLRPSRRGWVRTVVVVGVRDNLLAVNQEISFLTDPHPRWFWVGIPRAGRVSVRNILLSCFLAIFLLLRRRQQTKWWTQVNPFSEDHTLCADLNGLEDQSGIAKVRRVFHWLAFLYLVGDHQYN